MSPFPTQTWTRDGYIISTDTNLISLPTLNAAFDSNMMYWAKAIPESALRDMVSASICFGLYTPTPELPSEPTPSGEDTSVVPADPAETLHEIASAVKPEPSSQSQPTKKSESKDPDLPTMIGFGRLISDGVTFAYLTDVYVEPAWQGRGLGTWLIECIQEVLDSMPHLRRSMLITGSKGDRTVNMYAKLMKMNEIKDGSSVRVMESKGRGNVF